MRLIRNSLGRANLANNSIFSSGMKDFFLWLAAAYLRLLECATPRTFSDESRPACGEDKNPRLHPRCHFTKIDFFDTENAP